MMHSRRSWGSILMLLVLIHLSLQDDVQPSNKKILKALGDLFDDKMTDFLEHKMVAILEEKLPKIITEKIEEHNVMERFDILDKYIGNVIDACNNNCTSGNCTSDQGRNDNQYEQVPCPVSEGYFEVPGSDQCLRFFRDHSRNYEEAYAKCKSHGLALAKLNVADALAARRYIVEELEEDRLITYVRGRDADRSSFRWTKDDSAVITWGAEDNWNTGEWCLTLGTTKINLKYDPEEPLSESWCVNGMNTLCQYGWSSWSSCSATCGGGQRTRTRTVPSNNGQPLTDSNSGQTSTDTNNGQPPTDSNYRTETHTEACNTEICPFNAACPVSEDGYFVIEWQCFRFFNDEERSWEDADDTCKSHGLVLAKPDDVAAPAVRRHIVDNYRAFSPDITNLGSAWLGARADGSNMRWIRDNSILSTESDLWWISKPKASELTTDHCLEMLTTKWNMDNYSEEPYDESMCRYKNWYLCELI